MVRISATSRHIKPGRQHQRVVAVVLGDAAHHHDEAASSAASSLSRSAGRRRRAPAPCRAARRRIAGACGRDLEGPLVDHAEAHVLQHRHALRQRDRPAVAPDLEADARLARPRRAIEIDAERPVRRQRLDDRGCRRPPSAANRRRDSRRRTRRDSAPAARGRGPARGARPAPRRTRRSRCARSRRPCLPASRDRDRASGRRRGR